MKTWCAHPTPHENSYTYEGRSGACATCDASRRTALCSLASVLTRRGKRSRWRRSLRGRRARIDDGIPRDGTRKSVERSAGRPRFRFIAADAASRAPRARERATARPTTSQQARSSTRAVGEPTAQVRLPGPAWHRRRSQDGSSGWVSPVLSSGLRGPAAMGRTGPGRRRSGVGRRPGSRRASPNRSRVGPASGVPASTSVDRLRRREEALHGPRET